MKSHCTVRVLLLASSLVGSALLLGCGGEAPGESADLAANPSASVAVDPEPEAAPVGGELASTFTQAEDPSTYGVYLQQGGKARKVGSVKVQGHVNELTVESSASPSGERVAIVPNYDTFAGTELRVLDADGAERLLESVRVASPIWSPDSAELAYLVMSGEDRFELRISDGAQPGRTIGALDALRAKILGWSKEKDEIYVIRDEYQGGNAPVVSFGVVDVATGELRTTFASSEKGSTFYRDFQLVEAADGSVLVSFVKSTTSWAGGGKSRLQLATVNGTLLADHGETTDS